jgi:hypothetical protein
MSKLKLTTLATQDDSASVPADTIVNGTAKAWVNFNGTGAVAIRRAFNVSSITDNGAGNYTVNFTTTMPDADYSAQVTVGVTGNVSGSNPEFYGKSSNFLTTSVRAQSRTATGGTSDAEVVSVTIFS